MELAAFAAGIHALGQLIEEAGIEGAADERGVQVSRVDAGDTRSKAAFMVVRRPTTSRSDRRRRAWSAQALSLPLLHESTTLRGVAMTLDGSASRCYGDPPGGRRIRRRDQARETGAGPVRPPPL